MSIPQLAAAFGLKLKDFDNATLATLNNTIQGFGKISPSIAAFTPAFEAGLVDEDGKPFDLDSLIEATSNEVNNRVAAGTFE